MRLVRFFGILFGSKLCRVTMDFQKPIQELCQEIIACQSEEEAVKLTRRLKILLHDRIEELRGTVPLLPETTSTTQTDDSAHFAGGGVGI